MGIGIGDIVGGGFGKLFKDIVGSFKLDPTEKAKIEAEIDQRAWELKAREQEANLKIAEEISKQVTAQIEVNKVEAAGNLYQASWRPTVGYICCLGLLFEFFIRPIMSWGSLIWGWPTPPPLDMGDLIILLSGMLGLGTLRSYDKRGGK
jgi:hypothetical protein